MSLKGTPPSTTGAYVPLFGSDSKMCLITGIAIDECAVLQTPHKVHYQLYLEVSTATHECADMSKEGQICSAKAHMG